MKFPEFENHTFSDYSVCVNRATQKLNDELLMDYCRLHFLACPEHLVIHIYLKVLKLQGSETVTGPKRARDRNVLLRWILWRCCLKLLINISQIICVLREHKRFQYFRVHGGISFLCILTCLDWTKRNEMNVSFTCAKKRVFYIICLQRIHELIRVY